MDTNERRVAARTLGAAMSRIAVRRVFEDSVDCDGVRELFAFAQTLQAPIDDGRHLAGVVRAFSFALSAAFGRRARGL